MTLVTGGTGFIGRHLLAHLAANGEQVRALVRRTKAPRALPAGVEVIHGDLATGAGLNDALRGAETVIHLAGVTKALHTGDYYTGNVRATEQLTHAMAGRGIRLLHVSSMSAIGPSEGRTPVSEDAPPHPLTHYGKSKLEAERVVRDLMPEAVIVRPPVVYGPGDTDVFHLLKSISKGLVLEIAGGERWFSAIYVKDLVGGLMAALRTPGAAGKSYFLAHPKPLSWQQLGSAAARIMSKSPRVVTLPVPVALAVGACAEMWARVTGKPGIVSREKVAEALCMAWICDTSRAERDLAFVAPTGLEQGLAETLAWYKEAGWLKY
ncbi:MAG: NAD-dependent epimerase/dehydratase family protein [Candidatus Solibacter sp.]